MFSYCCFSFFFFCLFMLSGFIPFFLQDALNSHSHHFLDSLDRAQIHGTNILLPQEPRGSIICSSFQSPGSRFQPGLMGFLEEHVFIQEMLQQNSSKVCSGLCPKATKPAFSSGLGFFSALTNFVSQHP